MISQSRFDGAERMAGTVQKTESFAALQARLPERIIEKAVKGMLPHNALGRQLFRKLKVYKGAEHPHAAQQPKALALDPAASARARKASSRARAPMRW